MTSSFAANRLASHSRLKYIKYYIIQNITRFCKNNSPKGKPQATLSGLNREMIDKQTYRKCGRPIWSALIALIFLAGFGPVYAQGQPTGGRFTVARLKYGGGGDWYGNQSSLSNLMHFLRMQTNLQVDEAEARVEISDERLFAFPYLYMTGHGNVRFTEEEVRRLRRYLTGGGFLHADDNYGMEKSLIREMARVFPDKSWQPLPYDHQIYHSHFQFPKGLPKIHEHDGGPPKGLGLFHEGRLVVFYSGNTDLGDGWEDRDVHDDPEAVRLKALQMGTNIIVYALMH